MEKAIYVVKTIGSIVVGVGVGAVTANLIKVTTPEDAKKIGKICISVGSFFIAGLASAAASGKFEGTVDQFAEYINKWKAKHEKEETPIEVVFEQSEETE